MQYNSKYHHRYSIRLKGYDYAQAELCFITVCLNSWGCQQSGQVGGQEGGAIGGAIGGATGGPTGGPINSLKDRKQEGLKLTYSNPKPPSGSELQIRLPSG